MKIKPIIPAAILLGALVWTVGYYSSFFDKAVASKAAVHYETDLIMPPSDKPFPAEGQNCLACHKGIMPARPMDSEMMQQILKKGAELGDPNGCVVCHGGNPNETKDKDRAHSGVPAGSALKAFTPVPAALQVNQNTCGLCHEDHVYNAHRSIMNTDAGKIKTMMYSYGMTTENNDHVYGDHDMDDPDGMEPRFGTEKYKEYMRHMAQAFPGQYPGELKKLPEADISKIKEMPEQAGLTYLRNCNACHLSNKGYENRGHYRGMGCAACHSVYSNEGYYEGGDSILLAKTAGMTGHLMVHGMQGTRKSAMRINGHNVSGVQVSTCSSCHAAGRRIGHSYQGYFPYGHGDHRGPFDKMGNAQEANAGYTFKYMRGDAHHRIEKDGKTVTGLLCQDCHTTVAMHGNGNIGATTLADIEIECADCHGTPDKYPWELPLGFGEEFGRDLKLSDARGLADEPLEVTKKFGITYPREDGYILSSRGNPLGNVVRRGNKVIVHSDAGHDFEVPVLKTINKEDTWTGDKLKAKTAMCMVKKHMESLECYTCHSTWAPQYYGYKQVVDYSKTSVDWLAAAEQFGADGVTADLAHKPPMQEGGFGNWDYAYVSWESPALGTNGEGRVSPLTGVIQTVNTVLDKDGKPVTANEIATRADGISAIEMAPLQPHTASREARNCQDCHGNDRAMGYGIEGGINDSDMTKERYMDAVDNEGHNISRYTKAQINAIKGLKTDFLQIIDKQTGKQLMTVDSHWPTSMPLTKEQLGKLSRQGTCMACHQDIPDGSIPMKMLGKIAEVADLDFAPAARHNALVHENSVIVAWVKAFGMTALLLLPIIIIWYIIRREKIKTRLAKAMKKLAHRIEHKKK